MIVGDGEGVDLTLCVSKTYIYLPNILYCQSSIFILASKDVYIRQYMFPHRTVENQFFNQRSIKHCNFN